ncbi:single-stranded DNA binding protein [Haloferax larsenii]|uniref:Single-stranded DNA binding protein n=1 Tax=Haloferax larsenii TaxID=302484 RepID=A0ABY5RJ95_HALLR|nr:single-stranded DNA binding protein [Haloferax larsenii]UVE51647.1 single-stranded DNA binding protein [Haloferax larsenii]
MGVIEDVYDDLDTDVEFEKFEAAVNDKVEQMGGLADEETAAMLIAHELRDEEVNGIADIEPGMEDVKFLAKVVSVGDVRTFERDGEDEDGKVLNIEVADETGRIRVSLWDEMAAGAEENLEVGTVLRIGGRPKDGYSGVEVSASKVEEDPDAEVDVKVLDTYRVEDLALGLSDVNLKGKILDVGTVRTFDRDDGSEGRVSNLSVGDATGRVRVTMWDERADLVEELDAGQSVEVVDGYVRERDGSLELHVGSRGAVEVIDEDIEYVPETTDIGALELGQTVDIAGGVIESDSKRTFDRDDGSEGQVRNIRVRDDTGDIRVALWGEKADTDVDLADYVVITDVEIKDGWQDDLEASAGWRSSVTVMDDAPAGAGGDSDAGADQTSSQGLGAFSGESSGSDASTDSTTSTTAATSSSQSADDTTTSSGEVVEFTGTVVQAGNPVILDDGSETKTVETDADLGLGDEVTVSGPETGGRISADSVEVHTGAKR